MESPYCFAFAGISRGSDLGCFGFGRNGRKCRSLEELLFAGVFWWREMVVIIADSYNGEKILSFSSFFFATLTFRPLEIKG